MGPQSILLVLCTSACPRVSGFGEHLNSSIFRTESQLTEIQRWAEVTEQLLKVFEYSQMVLGKSWVSFPGTQLPDKWLCNWENSCDAVASDSGGPDSQLIEADCLWDWPEFKGSLGLREPEGALPVRSLCQL